jgi:DNA modification methylase
MDQLTILRGDCLKVLPTLPAASVQCCVTSPPYWGLRDYGINSQLGLEQTPQEYIANLLGVFREVWRVLREDGTLWLNLGDSYATNVHTGSYGKNADHCSLNSIARTRIPHGLKAKDLCGIPWRVAFALQADGWYLRSDIIWYKPNPMPESVTDRPTKAHEYLFLLTKQERYFYDAEAIRENSFCEAGSAGTWNGNRDFGLPNGQSRFGNPNLGGSIDGFRNKRSVWTIPTQAYAEAHFATFPEDLIKPCILAGSRSGDTVLDPFGGSGTTGKVAIEFGRRAVLIELNPDYVELARVRMDVTPGMF